MSDLQELFDQDSKQVREIQDNDIDDLDMQLDRFEDQDDQHNRETLQNLLLFNVQGLGKKQNIDGIEIYVRDKQCEEALKDLCRFCKRDDPDRMYARIELGKWKILQTDLLELLLTQYQDKVISYYIILLLVLLTEYPPDTNPKRKELVSYLRNYKEGFLRRDVIKTLMLHVASCIEKEEMTKAQKQIIELIIILLKNILQIQDEQESKTITNEIQKNLHEMTIINFIKEQALDALIYISSDLNRDYLQKHGLLFMEIFYHIFACFHPKYIVRGCNNVQRLQELFQLDQERKQKQNSKARHSQFGQLFQFKRKMDGTLKLFSDPNVQKLNVTNQLSGDQQRKQPIQRKIFKNQQNIFKKQIQEDIDIGILENDQLKQVSFFEKINYYFQEFIENSLQQVIEKSYEEIYKKSEKLEPNDKFFYIVILIQAVRFIRQKYSYDNERDKKNATVKANEIVSVLQFTQFELIYSIVLDETSKTKKKFDIKNFMAASLYLVELFYLLREMQNDQNSQNNRQNSKLLQQHIFRHDMCKFIKIGIHYCVEGFLDNQVLKVLVELQYIFFDILDNYSRGKGIMTLQTNQMVKKKIKQQKKNNKKQKVDEEQELADFIEKDDNQDGNSSFKENQKDKIKEDKSDNEHQNQSDEEEENEEMNQEDQVQFKERNFTLMSEFATLVDYLCIDKILALIDDDKILTNPESLNTSVFKYIERVVKWLKAEWIFFQADYLSIFQKILSNPEINQKISFKTTIVKQINSIIRSYLELFKQNQLLIVESLFRFEDKTTKDSIMNNYQDQETNNDALGDGEVGEFQDEEDDGFRITKKWCKVEDKALIENYDNFKELDNCEENLVNLLHNLGFTNKTEKDVKKRIKRLKLHKNKQKAQKIFNELYEGDSISLPDAVKDFRNIERSLQFDKENMLDFLSNRFELFIQKQKEYDKNDLNSTQIYNQDMALLPYQNIDFDILECKQVQKILQSLDFRGPQQGEIYWRIPGYMSEDDMNVIIDKLKLLFSQEHCVVEQRQKVKENVSDSDSNNEQNNNHIENRDESPTFKENSIKIDEAKILQEETNSQFHSIIKPIKDHQKINSKSNSILKAKNNNQNSENPTHSNVQTDDENSQFF